VTDYDKVPSGPWNDMLKRRKSSGQVKFQFTIGDLEMIYESGRKNFSGVSHAGVEIVLLKFFHCY